MALVVSSKTCFGGGGGSSGSAIFWAPPWAGVAAASGAGWGWAGGVDFASRVSEGRGFAWYGTSGVASPPELWGAGAVSSDFCAELVVEQLSHMPTSSSVETTTNSFTFRLR